MIHFTEKPIVQYLLIVHLRHLSLLCVSMGTGTFQLMGTIFYIGAEWSDGFRHMAATVSINNLIVTVVCCIAVQTGGGGVKSCALEHH